MNLNKVQGIHLILCFYEDIKIYFGLWPLSVSPRCQFVYTMAGQTPALSAELAEFRKITTFLGKTQHLMNTL